LQNNYITCKITMLLALAELPTGYTYIQLPSQLSPIELWPSLKWTDITHQYSNHFFRCAHNSTLGHQSDTTDSRCPTVTALQSGDHFYPSIANKPFNNISLSVGQWSEYLFSGTYGGHWFGLRLHSNASEVRPINTAVKVWRKE
jgi:hypothetical protein